MHRIFPVLAAVAVLFLAVSLALGLRIGDPLGGADKAALGRIGPHFLVGLATCLIVVLVMSIAVTYFIGTGRWCREVSDTYRLDPQFAARSNRLKRSAFPYALGGMLVMVIVAALGAAGDPAAALQVQPPGGLPWSTVHLAAALLGTAFLAFSFVMLWLAIDEHRRVIADILAEVRRIRQEKGLEV